MELWTMALILPCKLWILWTPAVLRSNVRWVWFDKISVWYQKTQHSSSTSHYKQKHRKRNKFHVHQCQGRLKVGFYLKNHNITIVSIGSLSPKFHFTLYPSSVERGACFPKQIFDFSLYHVGADPREGERQGAGVCGDPRQEGWQDTRLETEIGEEYLNLYRIVFLNHSLDVQRFICWSVRGEIL